MTNDSIYIPPNCLSLDKLPSEPQIRTGLQGPPGVGKTWEALTFPNPIVLNLDRGLGAHQGRKDVIEIPMYDPKFVDSIQARSGHTSPPNRRDAVVKWLMTEGLKLSRNQTLVIDSSTQLQNAFVAQYNINPVVTKNGKIDDYAVWNQKVDYFGMLCDLFKTLPCHVVFICHETPDRTKEGDLNGQVRPLITGQFGDQLASHFTDFFRCHAIAKPTPDRMAKFKEAFKLDDTMAKEWIASTPNETIYLWQTQSDEVAKGCKTSTLVGAPKMILADYKSFAKYGRKQTTTAV